MLFSLARTSNVLPLTLRVSRFTLIPAKIYDIKTWPRFSLRLGHAAALTTIQVVIHYRVAASLPGAAGVQVAVR